MHFETTVEIAAPAERVWEVLTDVDHWPDMSPSITRVDRIQGASLEPGARVRIKQPRMAAMTWQVTDLQPGRSFAWQAANPGILTIGTHDVRETPTGTAVTLGIEHSGPLAPIVGRLTLGRTRRYVGMEAAGLKQRSEARVEARS
jgi:uncharacterized protein YndB with AHSA1/START domain